MYVPIHTSVHHASILHREYEAALALKTQQEGELQKWADNDPGKIDALRT